MQIQQRWRGEYDALSGWIAAFETWNILVFHTRGVLLEEMRGFSLSESQLPVIVLNAKDTPRGRVFTLMHEFVHLMLNQGGVCDPLRASRRPATPDEEIEVFGNRVAGAILVPSEFLLRHPTVAPSDRSREWSEDTLRRLAEDFAVSREVILRRLLILGRTTEQFYEQKRREYLAQYRVAAERRREAAGYAPLYRVIVRDNGRRYTRLILDAYARDRITAADVADYLGVRLTHLGDIAEAVQERAAEA
jgi:Zn-dependent peptidase ImmA (M78 family)